MGGHGGLEVRTLLASWPSPVLILDRDLCIVEVNEAHLAVTGRERDEIVGRHVFEAFPAPAHDPDAVAGQAQLRASLEQVCSTRRPHRPPIHRYDVQVPGAPDRFEVRYWTSSNAPILDDTGELLGILHVVEEVTGYHEHLVAMVELYLAEIRSQGEDAGELAARFTRYLQLAVDHSRQHEEVVAEVEQLREALTSRATIEQAKGMLMLERGIGPDAAFRLLVRGSQQANIKVRDLAAKMVDRVRRGGGAGRRDDAPRRDRTSAR